ncbi:MAG TPA: hypothetical protein VGM92_00920 [Candidatus Kapabacteria bacterium]|jgi:hypothetical protein
MKHSSKIVDYLKSHSLMLAVVLFIASCVVVPYRVKWTHNKSAGDLAAGYYSLYSEPTGGQVMWRIRNELPNEFVERFIPAPPNRKSELATNDLTYFKERIREERIRSEHVSSRPPAPQMRLRGRMPLTPTKPNPISQVSDADFDKYLAPKFGGPDPDIMAYLNASDSERRIGRAELDSIERVPVIKDSIALASIVDSIFHEDSIKYEQNVRGNESEIAGREMASTLNASVSIDFGRMIPQVALTAFLCVLALLKTKKTVKLDSEH